MNSLPQNDAGSSLRIGEACICGRTFIQPGALHYHQRSCTKTKKRLAGALSKAKEAWGRKRRRILEPVPEKPSESQEMASVESEETIDCDNELQNVIVDSSEEVRTLSMRQTPPN